MRIRPQIVCLCGSTRFMRQFHEANRTFSLEGKIVLSVALVTTDEGTEVTESQKRVLDDLHLDKIDLADEVVVIDVDGYIGESTCREIAYATLTAKPVTFYFTDANTWMDANAARLGKAMRQLMPRAFQVLKYGKERYA